MLPRHLRTGRPIVGAARQPVAPLKSRSHLDGALYPLAARTSGGGPWAASELPHIRWEQPEAVPGATALRVGLGGQCARPQHYLVLLLVDRERVSLGFRRGGDVPLADFLLSRRRRLSK